MKRLPRAAAAAAVVAALLGACGKEPQVQAADTQPRTWDLPLASAGHGATAGYSATGSVTSEQRVDIASRLSGYILEMPVQEGDRVREGALLARLDAPEIEAGIHQAEAALQAAQAALDDAGTDFDAFRELHARGSVSDNEMRKMRLHFEAAQAAFEQARAARDTARAQRAYTDLRSPIDGWVVARPRRVGELVVPGMPLLTVESSRQLVFETYLAQQRAAGVRTGAPVAVSIDGLPGPLQGTVSRIVPSADPVTRSQLIKIALPETPALRPGMFGRAAFELGESPALVVPRGALVERGGVQGVFVVDGESLARFRWLRTGREWPDRVEVDGGLASGERIVAAAEPGLRDGDRIRSADAAR